MTGMSLAEFQRREDDATDFVIFMESLGLDPDDPTDRRIANDEAEAMREAAAERLGEARMEARA